MQKQISPFSKAELLPKEERIEILNNNNSMIIGIPKERSHQEKRICLTPDAVSALTNNGHTVLIEKGAGENASFDDNEYSIMAPFTQVAFIPKQDGYFMYVKQQTPAIDKDDQAAAYRSTIVEFEENKVDEIKLIIPLPFNKFSLQDKKL